MVKFVAENAIRQHLFFFLFWNSKQYFKLILDDENHRKEPPNKWDRWRCKSDGCVTRLPLCSLLGLAFLTQIDAFTSHPWCCVLQKFTPFYCWVVVHCVESHSLFIHPCLRGMSRFQFWGSRYEHLCIGFHVTTGQFSSLVESLWYLRSPLLNAVF